MFEIRFQFTERIDDNVLKEIKWNKVSEKKLNENFIPKRILKVNCLAKTVTNFFPKSKIFWIVFYLLNFLHHL